MILKEILEIIVFIYLKIMNQKLLLGIFLILIFIKLDLKLNILSFLIHYFRCFFIWLFLLYLNLVIRLRFILLLFYVYYSFSILFSFSW